ncbi:MAG: hypothetical protein H0V44_16395 [Planctomycetes bacterium]|nr:hypothetical protein [Planctomycetota bacterium]
MKPALVIALLATSLSWWAAGTVAQERAAEPVPAAGSEAVDDATVVDRAPMSNHVAVVAEAGAAPRVRAGRLPSLANTIVRLEREIAAMTLRIDEILAINRADRYDATLEEWDVAYLRDEQRERVQRQRQRVLLSEQIGHCFDKDGRAVLAEARFVVSDRSTDVLAHATDRRRANDTVNTLEWWAAARTAKLAALAQARRDFDAINAAREKRPAFVHVP